MKCDFVPLTLWKKIKLGSFTIFIAGTPCQVAQGLQNTISISENSLVVFPDIPAGTFFHTKNCYFPIDIISLDATNKIIGVWQATPNMDRVGPTPPGTKKVIEANLGWTKRNNLGPGTILFRGVL